jgi:transposase
VKKYKTGYNQPMKKRREALQKLGHSELVEHTLLLEGRVRVLEQQLRQLKATVKDSAEAKVAKNSDNSSIPSSQSQKAAIVRKPQAKRGAKLGHLGSSRHRAEADEVISCRVGTCSNCGQNLSQEQQKLLGKRQILELPPIQPLVREAWSYGLTCPCCGTANQAAYPQGFEKGRMLGAQLEAAIVYLHHAHPLSYERVQRIFEELFSLKLSLGTLANVVKRSTESLAQAAQAIRQQVKQSLVIGCDETGLRVEGRNQWQWVFQTPAWVYMKIHPRRAAVVIEQVLEAAKPEVWLSDLAGAQLKHPAQQHQLCLAHQVRDLQFALDCQPCLWAYRLQALFYKAMRLVKHRRTLAKEHYQAQVQAIERCFAALLEEIPKSKESQRLRRRYRKHQAGLFVFLHREDVPATNNASEQALRNSVIYRKVTGGFRTQAGAHLYANLISVLETARRQQRPLFATLIAILAGQSIFGSLAE